MAITATDWTTVASILAIGLVHNVYHFLMQEQRPYDWNKLFRTMGASVVAALGAVATGQNVDLASITSGGAAVPLLASWGAVNIADGASKKVVTKTAPVLAQHAAKVRASASTQTHRPAPTLSLTPVEGGLKVTWPESFTCILNLFSGGACLKTVMDVQSGYVFDGLQVGTKYTVQGYAGVGGDTSDKTTILSPPPAPTPAPSPAPEPGKPDKAKVPDWAKETVGMVPHLVATQEDDGGTQNVRLKWGKAPDREEAVAGYVIMRGDKDGNTSPIDNVGPYQFTYVDKEVPEGKWFYYVLANDAEGRTGPLSDEAKVSVVASGQGS